MQLVLFVIIPTHKYTVIWSLINAGKFEHGVTKKAAYRIQFPFNVSQWYLYFRLTHCCFSVSLVVILISQCLTQKYMSLSHSCEFPKMCSAFWLLNKEATTIINNDRSTVDLLVVRAKRLWKTRKHWTVVSPYYGAPQWSTNCKLYNPLSMCTHAWQIVI